MDLELIIQIISILGFFAGAVMFFVKTGEYKTNIDKDIKSLQTDLDEAKKDIKDLRKEVDKVREESTRNTTRFESLLIEVKTKLEFFMQMSGVFVKDINERSKT
jgi:predicted  nucleic acid-binding Zn-ribbon protein